MSTIVTSNVSDGTLSIPTTYVTNGSAKAWANLNGTGTIALQDSFNVSGVTDNGTGLYTFTFSSAMDNANYVLSGAADTGSAFANVVVARTRLAGSQQIVTTNGTAADLSPTIGIHGDLA